MLGALVWVVIGVTCAIRVLVIWGSFFWQDDYIHIWTAWNAPASDLVWQNWNGHREPAGFAVQWLLARWAPQVWWPAALLLSLLAVAMSVTFWLMLRRWGGTTPGTATAAILFAAWPALMVPQAWLSAGLELVPVLLMLIAGWLLARPGRWTPVPVGLLAVLAWGFHERAVYFLPALAAIALFYSGGGTWRRNRGSWLGLLLVTAAGLVLRLSDDLPGRAGGASVPGSLWSAGPGSLLRSVLGWLPFDGRTVVPVAVGLWGLAVLVLWMTLLLVGLALAPHRTLIVGGVATAFLVVEVLSFVWLRGGFAGSPLAADPRFTVVTGTVLLAGVGSFPVTWRPLVWVATALATVGCWSMWRIGQADDPGRAWLAAADGAPAGADLAATPSPPAMLSHFFFTTQPPVYELGTTRTLLQVGPDPPRFPEVATEPVQIDEAGAIGPLTFTVLAVDGSRQCDDVRVPRFDAGVRVARLSLTAAGRVEGVPVPAGDVYVFPPAGRFDSVRVVGACVYRVEVGIPGR